MSTIQIVGYFYAWILLGIAFTWCIRGLWRDRQSWAAHKHGMRVIWRDVRSARKPYSLRVEFGAGRWR